MHLTNVTAAIIRKNGRILIARRGPASFMSGKWEFPGGKVEEGESLEDCLKREILEELGIDILVGKPFHAVLYDYPEKGTVRLHSFLCSLSGGEPKAGHSHSNFMWVTASELKEYDFAPADISIVEKLLTEIV